VNSRVRRLRKQWQSMRFKRADPARRAELLRERGATVGTGCRIHTTGIGSEPYLIGIGDETTVAPGVQLITHDAGTWVFRKEHPLTGRFGRITIGSRVYIGVNAIVLPGVTIGDRCIIGAGAVVTRDVASGSVVAGVPARVICTVDDYLRRTLEQYPLLEPSPPGGRRPEELRRLLEERYPPA